MPLINFTPGTAIKSADMNANLALAVLTDTSKNITVTHTWTASQTFTGGWTAAAACTISAGGIAVTGASSIVGALTGLTGLTVGGLVTVSAGGIAVTGASSITGALTVSTTLGVTGLVTASGGIKINGSAAFAAGELYKDVTDGLLVSGTAGSSNDFALYGPTGAGYIFRVPTGTLNVILPTGTLTAAGLIGNVTGNLTGTVLTASQTNITAVGALTSLSVTGLTTFSGGITAPHYIGSGATPSIAAGANSGGMSNQAITGTDTAGKITGTYGIGCTAGAKFVVTFATAYAAAPSAVSLTSGVGGSSRTYNATNILTTGFTIDDAVAGSAFVNTIYYQVIA